MQVDGSNNDAGELVRLNDLSLKSVIALVERLRATESTNDYLSRELELDEAFFWAEENLKLAQGQHQPRETLAGLTQIRDLVLNAHDFVGGSNVHAAIAELNKVIELKIGL